MLIEDIYIYIYIYRFQNQLPLYLAIQDNTQPLDSSLKMKESLLDKLYSLEMDIPEDREVVKTSILCRERKDFCVVYEILLSISEKEERLMYLKSNYIYFNIYIYIYWISSWHLQHIRKGGDPTAKGGEIKGAGALFKCFEC